MKTPSLEALVHLAKDLDVLITKFLDDAPRPAKRFTASLSAPARG